MNELLPGRLIGGQPLSGATHERMHQALALAAKSGHHGIPCEACGELSGSIGDIDTREVEGMLDAMQRSLPYRDDAAGDDRQAVSDWAGAA